MDRKSMTQSDFKIEWLYSNIRWFYLVAVTAVLGIQTTVTPAETIFTPTIIALLITGAIANLLVMLMLMLNAFRRPMTFFTLTLDVSLTLGLIQATGGPSSPLIFVAFIPIITTALRYSWPVSLLVTGGTVLLYWWTAWRSLELSWTLGISTLWNNFLGYITNGLILLTAGVAMSRVGFKIRQLLLVERTEEERESQAALDSAHQRVRLIFELASTLSATLNYERVLQAALDVSQAGLRELVGREISQIQMILLFGMDQSLYVATSHGLTASDRRARFPAQAGALAESLKKAGAVVVDEPGTDPELGKVIAMHQCRQASVVPLRAGFESYGVMVVASTEDNVYTKDFQDLLDAICNQAVMALQNAQLYQNLMEEKERLVAVEEDARKKLARDLHDGPTQTIAAIAMRLNYIRMLISREPERAHEELQQLEELARRTTKIIRQMLFTLRPLILESQGLVAALEQYRAKITETDDIAIHLEAEEGINRYLDKESQGSIFYIIEEAMTNARKHAQASDLWIRLYKRGMNVIAEVEDNGVGFDVASVEESYAERTSLGMLNLRERASLVGGKTVIKSNPGQGTKISVTIPIHEALLANGR
ncbi:MAG: GAF domain-containing sensor histidine kinase [Anaerolineales bacterium]